MTELHPDQSPRVTRDADVAPEVGELFQLFNHCCEGYSTRHIVEAAIGIVAAAIVVEAEAIGSAEGRAFARVLVDQVINGLIASVSNNYGRKKLATDIDVPDGN